MQLKSRNFRDGEPIPGEFAFAVVDPKNHFALSTNRNPHLQWSDVPEGTKSFALILHDSDVPSRTDDVNQEGKTVPASLPRMDFFHWLLLDIPPNTREIESSRHSNGVTPRGKPGPDGPEGLCHASTTLQNGLQGTPRWRGGITATMGRLRLGMTRLSITMCSLSMLSISPN